MTCHTQDEQLLQKHRQVSISPKRTHTAEREREREREREGGKKHQSTHTYAIRNNKVT